MAEKRLKFDKDSRAGAVRNLDRQAREGAMGVSTGNIAELKRLRAENAEPRMERRVLKRSVVRWVKEVTR